MQAFIEKKVQIPDFYITLASIFQRSLAFGAIYVVGILQKFHSMSHETIFERARYGLREISELPLRGIFKDFRFALQRYVNLSALSKFFGKKMLKKCIL